ncbi:MFS general substrate transporter [Xylariaceae sp. FL0594]|nr:MFS general substrate transporter [Xylariaceae sp. FL0594]
MESDSSSGIEKSRIDVTDVEVASYDDYSPAQARSIMKRIDRRLVTVTGIMYCISVMDRTNLGAAAIAGMNKDLQLINNRYSLVTLLFFITYILFQPPATVICRKLGPRPFLAFITIAWGIVLIGLGLVHNWGSLAVLRIVLGLFEAGFFPSVIYLLGTWYTRFEMGKRYAFFYVIGCLASAFSGILAFGLIHLNGAAGLAGWRWIFVFEGLLTVVIGAGGYWLLVDFPDSDRKVWSFLSAEERAWVVRKVKADRGDAEVTKFDIKKFLGAGTDWRIWAYGFMGLGTSTINYSFSYFLPIILKENLKFGSAASQILVAPPYGFAAIYMFGINYLGDKYKYRGPVIIFNMLICLVGIPILGWHTQPYVRYFGAFLICAGANANLPSALALQGTNIRGQWKRAFCSALFVGLAGIGGIAGALVFRDQDKKTGYKPGLWACITAALLVTVLTIVCDISYWRANKAADRGEKDLECDEDAPQPGYRYTL